MTAPRSIFVAAIVLCLLSIGLSKPIRLEGFHSPPSRPPLSSSDVFPSQGTDRLALVIGNADYPDAPSPLRQVTRDAEALAGALQKDGFLVDRIANATRAEMTRAVDQLKARTRSNSIVLVYFGGYGVQSEGQNYLIPIDAKIWSEEDVRQQGVTADGLLWKLDASKLRLAIVDASRRNPYERRFRTYSRGLAPIQAGENMLILSSAGPDQVVQDSDGPYSQLMTTLLAQMRSSRGMSEVFASTREAVADISQGQRIPAVSSSLNEDFKLWEEESDVPSSSDGLATVGGRG